jgi:metal-responsive CopG/Arc/MetJ family transcriptional regulator
LPKDLVTVVDKYVKNSELYLNRSEFIREAIKVKLLKENPDLLHKAVVNDEI